MKSSLLATPVLFAPFISLLLLGIVIWNFSALAVAQSLVPDDVKHDTPGQVIKQGQAVHIDVDLALVNVTVTDPYNRLVTGLEPDTWRPAAWPRWNYVKVSYSYLFLLYRKQ